MAENKPGKLAWTVTSDGTDIAKLEFMGRKVHLWARDLMSKPDYVITTGKTYRLVGIRAGEISAWLGQTTDNIRKEAFCHRHYQEVPAEAATLLRRMTHDELGCPYLVVMHPPIRSSYGRPALLVLRKDRKFEILDALEFDLETEWREWTVFVFLDSKIPVVS